MLTQLRQFCYSVTTCFVMTLAPFVVSLFSSTSNAYAIPAFARETGMECSACHVGSFGPQLTQTGRNFKLYGFMLGNSPSTLSDFLKGFSAMMFGGVEHTDGALRKGTELTGHARHLQTNDNLTLDQASLFYGGALSSHIGMLAQATYNQPDDGFAWDNTEIRYSNQAMLGNKPLIFGVTLNNNPAVQDLWQSTPAWRFPYLSSALLPSPTASPYMTSLGGTVGGVGIYGMWNNLLYAELSGYGSLPNAMQSRLGETDAAQTDHLRGLSPYWRLALQHDFGPHYVQVGTFGMYADRYPDNVRSNGTDKFLDYAVDASYQYTSGNGKHSVSVYASALRENANLDASYASGDASNLHDSLTDLHANASYYYDNTYGLTFGPFSTTGSADATLYSNPVNNKPNSSGWTLQADYTPFGREGAPGYPNMNMRLYAQYTAYGKFNGLSSNYDGTGRDASDNNMFFTGIWLAF